MRDVVLALVAAALFSGALAPTPAPQDTDDDSTPPPSPVATSVPRPGVVPHLAWARNLVAAGGDDEASHRSVASAFVTTVLQRAYHLAPAALETRFGTERPDARDYFSAIVEGRGFVRVRLLGDIKPGDVIVVRYAAGSSPTGTVFVADAKPSLRRASAPVLEGTRQFDLRVLDAATSPHGMTDSRYVSIGLPNPGAGRGTIRLYADPLGTIAGYTWSTRGASKFYAQDQRELVVGRFVAAAPPSSSEPKADAGSDEGPDPNF